MCQDKKMQGRNKCLSEAHRILAACDFKLERYEDAYQNMKQSLGANNDWNELEKNILFVRILIQLKNYKKAVSILDRLIEKQEGKKEVNSTIFLKQLMSLKLRIMEKGQIEEIIKTFGKIYKISNRNIIFISKKLRNLIDGEHEDLKMMDEMFSLVEKEEFSFLGPSLFEYYEKVKNKINDEPNSE